MNTETNGDRILSARSVKLGAVKGVRGARNFIEITALKNGRRVYLTFDGKEADLLRKLGGWGAGVANITFDGQFEARSAGLMEG